MKNRTPVPRDERPPIPDFAPVPREKIRHDGWTPDRQRAFIEALADTGSVTIAGRMVNMSTESAYGLRRHAAAGAFRAAWSAALDMGVQRLKDEAFDRAINGQVEPIFTGGKLVGHRRRKNDRLLMFCLRHYGEDAQGRRVTLNYFGDKRPALSTPDPDASPDIVAAFDGVALDDEAQAQILIALEACAARTRALPIEDNPDVPYILAADVGGDYVGALEHCAEIDDYDSSKPDEVPWTMLDDHVQLDAIDAAVASIEAAKARPDWVPLGQGATVAKPVLSVDPDIRWEDFPKK